MRIGVRPPSDSGQLCTSALGCEVNWSLEHMPEISLLVFRSLTSFSGVRSIAEPPFSGELVYTWINRFHRDYDRWFRGTRVRVLDQDSVSSTTRRFAAGTTAAAVWPRPRSLRSDAEPACIVWAGARVPKQLDLPPTLDSYHTPHRDGFHD